MGMMVIRTAIPVNYYYDRENQKIYFHGAREGHKADALRANDKVCFTVYGNEKIKKEEAWAPFVQSTVVFGRCHLLETGEKAMTLLKQLAMKYYPTEQLVDEKLPDLKKQYRFLKLRLNT